MDSSTKMLTVRKIMGNINKGKVTFDHPIQRKSGQWDTLQQSLLLHSMLSEYPVPAIYTIQTNTEDIYSFSVIDGKQRLTTINDFINGKFKLSEETPSVMLNGEEIEIADKKFAELAEELQEEIYGFDFQVYIFANCTDDEVEEVFYRLNNGTALTKDQKTRVKLGNRLAEFIDEVTELPFFKEKANFSKLQLKRGEDQTCILQTLMLLTEYDFKNFNNNSVLDFAEWYRDNFTEEQLSNCKEHFEKLSGLLPESEKPIKMVKKINIPMFVVILEMAVNSRIEAEEYRGWIEEFINSYYAGCPYSELCGQQSTSRIKVQARVDFMFAGLSNYINRKPVTIPDKGGEIFETA